MEIVKYEPTGFGKVKTLVSKVIGLSAQAEKRKFVGIVEEKVPQEGLQEAADEFNKLYSKESNYIAKGTAISYRQIRIPKIDSRLHYEFMHTNKNGLCIEFHIEADGYGKLATLLKEWAESKKTLNGLDILFDPKWSRGQGRVYIMAGSESTPEANANTMKALIEQTEPIIKSTIGVN